MISVTNDKSYSNEDKDYPREWEDRAILVGIEAMREMIKKELEAN